MFEHFWRRELDIEDVAVIAAVLTQAGADEPAFAAQAQAGRDEVAAISRAAEAIGLFGVPSFVVDGQLFWGSEHLPDIRTMLATEPTKPGEMPCAQRSSAMATSSSINRGPRPSDGQVLVKTLCCGICGTDLHAAKHTQQFVERSRRAGGRWPMDPARDVVFGHEFCCEIVE